MDVGNFYRYRLQILANLSGKHFGWNGNSLWCGLRRGCSCWGKPQRIGPGSATLSPCKIKVARLQSEFCTKDFFLSYEFSCPEIFPEFLSLSSVGQKKSRKIPAKFPTKFPKFPCEKSRKIHRRASAGAQREYKRVLHGAAPRRGERDFTSCSRFSRPP